MHAGEVLHIRGEGFSGELSASLITLNGANYPLEAVNVVSPEAFEGVVPVYTEPGTYDLVVSSEGVATGLERSVEVRRPRAEIPCTGEYTANTQISLAKQLVTIDRFHRDGTRETLRIEGRDIAGIEYEHRTLPIGDCWVVFLVRTDGSKVVFDDDPKVDLMERSQKMARDLGKPFVDATAVASPPGVTPP